MRTYALFIIFTLFLSRPLVAESVPFDVCAESTTWVRPSPEVQAEIWKMGRYQSFVHSPYYNWTHDFIVVDDPLSASVAYDVQNLSGLWTEPIENRCDNNRRNGEDWIEVWILVHRVTQVTHDGNTYTITVEPTGKGFQSVFIPRMNSRAVLRFVIADGTVLESWNESVPPGISTVNDLQGKRIMRPNGSR